MLSQISVFDIIYWLLLWCYWVLIKYSESEKGYTLQRKEGTQGAHATKKPERNSYNIITPNLLAWQQPFSVYFASLKSAHVDGKERRKAEGSENRQIWIGERKKEQRERRKRNGGKRSSEWIQWQKGGKQKRGYITRRSNSITIRRTHLVKFSRISICGVVVFSRQVTPLCILKDWWQFS